MKGGSLSDVGTGVGVLCRPGGQGKRVATIAAFRKKSRFCQPFQSRDCPLDRKIMPERRHSCSRLTLTLFFSLSDTQTTTPVCRVPLRPHTGWPTSQGPHRAHWTCCNIDLLLRVYRDRNLGYLEPLTQKRESTDVSSTVNVKFPAQA